MIDKKQIDKIREHLENAKNPVFFYDNDADGLCSFLILRRYLGRGNGVAIRSYPELDKGYAGKAKEFGSDYVFILDKPLISGEFVERIADLGLPIVWIDHHDINHSDFAKLNPYFFKYNSYNPRKKYGEPATAIAYEVCGGKDVWIGVAGCIADHFLPDFVKEFEEKYPEFWGLGIRKPFDAYYGTKIGEIAFAMNFGLKDSTANIVRMQDYLIKCNSPGEVLEENFENEPLRKRYKIIKRKFDNLIEEALAGKYDKNLLYFEYGGDTSFSADVANKLLYLNKSKYVLVAFRNGEFANLSFRGKNVKKHLEKVMKKFPDMTGGGHEDAVGAKIKMSDLENFRKEFYDEITS